MSNITSTRMQAQEAACQAPGEGASVNTDLGPVPSIITPLPGPKGAELLAMSKQYEPNCMSDQVPLVWRRGKNAAIEDVDGNRFIDFTSGVLVTNVGHCHPQYVAEMKQQAEELYNCYDFVTEHRARLAKKLVEMTAPNLDKCFIVTTGSEATEGAVKMARRASEGYEIVAFHGAFHGRTYGAMALGGLAGPKRGFGPFMDGVIHAPFCYCYRCPIGHTYPECNLACIDHLDWVVSKESSGKLCALITEPYQGGAGSIIPPPGYMERLQQWIDGKGIFFILDEVQSSFGRTGKMFAYEHYDIRPNLVCLGKGLGSGIPCSAIVGESRIMDVLGPGELSSTNGGNPVSSRAALAAIEIIEKQNLCERSERLGAQMLQRLQRVCEQVEILGDVRGQGLVLGLEIVEDKRSKAPAPALTKRIVRGCYEKGLALIAPIGMYGNVIRIAPPLTIEEDLADLGTEILERVLREVR
jgi:4-aminobutyrate aminotransferase